MSNETIKILGYKPWAWMLVVYEKIRTMTTSKIIGVNKDTLELARSRAVEQEVLNLLDAPAAQ